MSRGISTVEPRARRLRYASWEPQPLPEMYYDVPEPEPPARPARAQANGQGGSSSTVTFLVFLVLVLAGWIAWKNHRDGFSGGPGTAPYSTAADSAVHWVNADNVNLRSQPEARARVLYVLPRNTRVLLLGEYQTELNGDTWAKVRVQVGNGYAQDGWIIYRYVN